MSNKSVKKTTAKKSKKPKVKAQVPENVVPFSCGQDGSTAVIAEPAAATQTTQTVIQIVKTEIDKSVNLNPQFGYDDIEELISLYKDEMGSSYGGICNYAAEYDPEREAKRMRGEPVEDKVFITLMILKAASEVKIYRVPVSDEIFCQIDAKYASILEESSSGNDFWDRWNAMLSVFEPWCIVNDDIDLD